MVPNLYRSRKSNGGIVTSGMGIGKKKITFRDSEPVKGCILAAIDEVVTDEKNR